LQKRVKDANGAPIDDEIEAVYAVHVKPGDSLFIPSEWGHLVVNISDTYLSQPMTPLSILMKQILSPFPDMRITKPSKRCRVFVIT